MDVRELKKWAFWYRFEIIRWVGIVSIMLGLSIFFYHGGGWGMVLTLYGWIAFIMFLDRITRKRMGETWVRTIFCFAVIFIVASAIYG